MANTDNGAQRNLAALRLPELRKIASEMGLRGTSGLRKGDLIAVINGQTEQMSAAQGAPSAAEENPSAPKTRNRRTATSAQTPEQEESADSVSKPRRRRAVTSTSVAPGNHESSEPAAADGATESNNTAETEDESGTRPTRRGRRGSRGGAKRGDNEVHPENAEASDQPESAVSSDEETTDDEERRFESRSAARRSRRNRARHEQREGEQQENSSVAEGDSEATEASDEHNDRRDRRNRNDRGDRDQNNESADNSNDDESGDNNERGHRNNRGDRDDRGGRRNRRGRRGRDRGDRENREGRDSNDNNQSDGGNQEDLQPIAGILDVIDSNTAFVRTSGYHAGPADVYVNNQMIRRFGLRAGDAITGMVRMRGEGGGNNNYRGNRGNRNRQKYNPLARVESVNGMTVEEAKARPEFSKLTPLYPNQRLRLETDPKILTTRVIDLIMPIGKGQRALIVSPPKAGKTTILQNIANAITTNNPECYLMVVLVDERPEEVTDMQRSVKGEVISSTFDRPPGEHTAVAELAIERAKRLVEQGQDVVILLDSITRLGRAYNNSSPASGRILSGGVDSNALYPPKRFLGAARNIENGGSLTIIATAMVETGSAGDTVIFEEFKGTGNAELKLDRKISERRVFPAVDVAPSGTRKDELLLAPEEAKVMHKLRRILSALDSQQAIDLLIKQLKKTKSNGEFLMQMVSSQPLAEIEEDE